MDILNILASDYDEMGRALEELASLTHDEASLGQIRPRMLEVVPELRIRMAAEERVLYETALSTEGRLREAALAGRIEHDLIGRVLDRLVETTPGGDGEFRAVLGVLVELLRLHVRRTVNEAMFPALRTDLTEDERVGLGAALTMEKQRLLTTDGFARRR